MANSVIFLKGTAAQYASATKNENTFYYTTDDAQLYLGSIKLSNAGEIVAAVERIETLESLVTIINGDATVDGSIKKAVADAKAELEAKIGNLENLSTTAKGNLVEAVNEVRAAISAGGTAAAISLSTAETSEGAAKSYTLYQGETKVGVIDIPKDMVVQSGEVVINPEGQAEGTYIKLTLANATNDVLYINVGTLVDIYKAQADAAKVQLTIDASTREISATIVAGSITDVELAANAVTTEKIADGNVILAKLSTAVQTSLGLADSALQAADITTGSENGTIAVEGIDVAVKGLGSAAYTEANAYDVAGAASTVQGELNSYKTSNDATVGTLQTDLDAVEGKVAALETAVGEGGAVADQITSAVEALDVEDTAVDGQYVSAVSEADGKITVTRAELPKLEWETIA